MAEMKNYEFRSDDQQRWMNNYFFKPRGIGFYENGTVTLDSDQMSAYNIAKSCYQIHPEVFNLRYISQTVGINQEEIISRIKRMYNDRLIMLVMNAASQVYGWGLYYWLVKLKNNTPKEKKDNLSNWFQEKDDICTGYECSGDFDYYNGNHIRVLDNLLYDILAPWKDNKEVEFVHLCPIRRDVRESNVNMWDAPEDTYREYLWGKGQVEKLLAAQDKMDYIDFKIIYAINNTKSVEDMFDYDVLSDLSGLDADKLMKDMKDIVDQKKIIIPLIYLNFKKLGLTMRMFVIRLFQTITCSRKAQIVDELAEIPELNNIYEFSDSFYDILITAYNELTDVKAIRDKLEGYGEIEEIKEANINKQFRRWECRLDDDNGYWEECVFTDDFLQNRMQDNLDANKK